MTHRSRGGPWPRQRSGGPGGPRQLHRRWGVSEGGE